MANIDDEIEKLEAQLNAFSDEESETSDTEDVKVVKSDIAPDDVIPPLPAKFLPATISKKTDKKKSTKRKSVETITEDISKKTKQYELMQYINGYQPSEKLPFNCRICKVQSTCLEEFEAHRHSREHIEKVELEENASFCRLCRKPFTSPLQLSEHLKGKAHKEFLAIRMKSSRRLKSSKVKYEDSR